MITAAQILQPHFQTSWDAVQNVNRNRSDDFLNIEMKTHI